MALFHHTSRMKVELKKRENNKIKRPTSHKEKGAMGSLQTSVYHYGGKNSFNQVNT
jgi:hypothetical protein